MLLQQMRRQKMKETSEEVRFAINELFLQTGKKFDAFDPVVTLAVMLRRESSALGARFDRGVAEMREAVFLSEKPEKPPVTSYGWDRKKEIRTIAREVLEEAGAGPAVLTRHCTRLGVAILCIFSAIAGALFLPEYIPGNPAAAYIGFGREFSRLDRQTQAKIGRVLSDAGRKGRE